MDTNTSIADPNGQASNGTVLQPQAGNSNGQVPNEAPNIAEDLQRQIAELRKENASHRRKFQEQTQASQAAEEARLKEQGEFQKLAEQHQSRVKELEPISEKYTQLTELVSAQIKAQTKDWPPEIKTFDPGENASIEDRLAWMEKSKPLIEKLQASKPGNGPNPKPSQGSAKEAAQTAFDKLRATGQYGRF